ncbi:hypothetical protein M3Y98_00492400 [Aphelenchoides besseyi]|nr:hypothetical protein M3Y98_00492400 [Aphelenchoides besseyi]
MWNEEQCCEFLKKYCDQYPECDLRKDSAILAKERLNPSCFNKLTEIFDRDVTGFKNLFPEFSTFNAIALYEGMKRYARKNEESIGMSRIVNCRVMKF